jgi:hypothetical protein
MNIDEVKIEKNIPMPLSTRGGSKYPFLRMDVGDSVFIAGMTPAGAGSITGHARRKAGFKFTSRAVEGGVRVWRIA